MPLRRRMPKTLLLLASVFTLLMAQRAVATVTITDCTADARCHAIGKKTVISAPLDTVVVAGAIAPLAGTEDVQIRAHAIAVDGSSGGQISATGKGRSIVLDAASILVTGALHSANTNGKIFIRAVDMVQMQGPLDIDGGGGQTRVVCTGIGCTIAITGVHFSTNFLFIDALGDVIWDMNTANLRNPRDLAVITSEGGSIRKTGAITVALANGRLAAQVPHDKVDAVSEAVSFCETCQTTPTGTTESTLTIRALNDIDLNHDHYIVAENITVTAGGNIDLTGTELRNDFGKCGEIVVTAGGQVNIQDATLVDDDCRNNPDVSTINGREEVPHTGFNDVVGFPAVDD